MRTAILFDVGGPIDMEMAWEIAVDGAIASACAMERIAVDEEALSAASERAVAVFAPDAYAFMIEDLCGGDPAAVRRVTDRMRAMVGGLDVFQMRPDMPALLRKLAARGLKLGIVANQPERMARRLAREGVADLFAYLGPSGTTGLRKPDPKAFLAACEALGVSPTATIVVGDRIDNDIAPAKALGIATIRFRAGRHRRQVPRGPREAPDIEVADVMELERALDQLLGG